VSARARRILALVLALAIAVISAGAGFAGMVWGFGLRCDDTCGEAPPWRDDEDAWQWSALGWTGIAAAGLAIAFLIALGLRLRPVAAIAAAGWLAVFAWYLVLLDESGLTSNAHRGWFGLTLAVAAMAVAIAWTPKRERP
jgi:hypothetical protein